MKPKAIPDDVVKELEKRVAKFNRSGFRSPQFGFVASYRGKNVYLGLVIYGDVEPRCRISYTGDMNKWKFAIYKSSTGGYSEIDWMFPGSQYVDGTIEGAMNAALRAYS